MLACKLPHAKEPPASNKHSKSSVASSDQGRHSEARSNLQCIVRCISDSPRCLRFARLVSGSGGSRQLPNSPKRPSGAGQMASKAGQ